MQLGVQTCDEIRSSTTWQKPHSWLVGLVAGAAMLESLKSRRAVRPWRRSRAKILGGRFPGRLKFGIGPALSDRARARNRSPSEDEECSCPRLLGFPFPPVRSL